MIKNKIIEIYPDTIEDITAEAKANNFYLVNLDGRTIHNEGEYLKAMFKGFLLPSWDHPRYNEQNHKHSYHVYDHWIRDLSWLQNEGYKGFVLIIDYYKSFLANEPDDEHHLEDGKVVYKFKEYLEVQGFPDITRYWEFERIKCGPGDCIPRSFNIYLVDR